MGTQLLVIAALTVMVVAAALGTRRWQRPVHATVTLDGYEFPEGFVVFTSTECVNCKTALARLKATDLPVREVTWELEGKTIEALGVAAVPLVVKVGPDGSAVAQTVGVPSQRWLRRHGRID